MHPTLLQGTRLVMCLDAYFLIFYLIELRFILFLLYRGIFCLRLPL